MKYELPSLLYVMTGEDIVWHNDFFFLFDLNEAKIKAETRTNAIPLFWHWNVLIL